MANGVKWYYWNLAAGGECLQQLVRKGLRRFSVRDLVLIAVMAALGVAIKPLVVPLVHLVSAPLLIPGGALAGGFYMMWLVVAAGLVPKPGAASLCALVQAILVLIVGISGSHGAFSLLSYGLPGLVVDLGLLLIRKPLQSFGTAFYAGILANLTGTVLVNLIFFRLPLIPLLLSVFVAAFSGGLGGLLAWQVIRLLRRYQIGRPAEQN